MRHPKPEELTAIRALLDEHGDMIEQAQQKEAEINHAIHALKRLCQVSRTPGAVQLDVGTWKWMAPAGKDAQGQPVNKPLVCDEDPVPGEMVCDQEAHR